MACLPDPILSGIYTCQKVDTYRPRIAPVDKTYTVEFLQAGKVNPYGQTYSYGATNRPIHYPTFEPRPNNHQGYNGLVSYGQPNTRPTTNSNGHLQSDSPRGQSDGNGNTNSDNSNGSNSNGNSGSSVHNGNSGQTNHQGYYGPVTQGEFYTNLGKNSYYGPKVIEMSGNGQTSGSSGNGNHWNNPGSVGGGAGGGGGVVDGGGGGAVGGAGGGAVGGAGGSSSGTSNFGMSSGGSGGSASSTGSFGSIGSNVIFPGSTSSTTAQVPFAVAGAVVDIKKGIETGTVKILNATGDQIDKNPVEMTLKDTTGLSVAQQPKGAAKVVDTTTGTLEKLDTRSLSKPRSVILQLRLDKFLDNQDPNSHNFGQSPGFNRGQGRR